MTRVPQKPPGHPSAGTGTRSTNLAAKMRQFGARVLDIDTEDDSDWEIGLDLAVRHVL